MKSHPLSPNTPEKPDRKPHEHEDETREENIREANLDKTIEDSFPASDPPSSIPDPEEEEDAA